MLPGIKENDFCELSSYKGRKTIGSRRFFSKSNTKVGLSKIALKMQADKAIKHIESYKNIKNRESKEVLHEFPSVDKYYKKIFLEQASHLKINFKEKQNISFISTKMVFSPKKDQFKLKRHQDYFSPMFPSKRSLSPVRNSITSTSLSSY